MTRLQDIEEDQLKDEAKRKFMGKKYERGAANQ
jgi:hypothetical protein